MAKELTSLASSYPVVTVTGPRQSGKTTLVKDCFPELPYVNLEEPDIRLLATEDPREFFKKYEEGAIIDEIQRVPSLLSYIQVLVDKKDRSGMFILTGSHQLELSEGVSQSLAGRTAILHLLPLSISELLSIEIELSIDEYLLSGFFPRVHTKKLNPTQAYAAYVKTYVERDLRKLINLKELSLFERFLKLCASRVGQVLQLESLGNDVGVSGKTIKHWLSILEASFLVFRLPPYFENFGKRVVKSPKLYFTDVGLAAYLLDIENTTQMNRDPLRGNLFENLVILELIKTRFNRGLDAQLYFYRDSNGREVDVIFKKGHQLVPIEIKSARTTNMGFFKNLKFFQELVKDRCDDGYLIYTGEQEQTVKGNTFIHYKHSAQITNSI